MKTMLTACLSILFSAGLCAIKSTQKISGKATNGTAPVEFVTATLHCPDSTKLFAAVVDKDG